MKHKESFILIIFLFTFLISFYVIQPQYTGYVTANIFQDKIDILQSLQENQETLEILQALKTDMPSAISALNNYDSQIQTIEQDTTLNETEKQDMILNVEKQVDDFLADIPKLLTITNKISDLPAALPLEIKQEMLPTGANPEEILYFQEQVKARTDIKVFSSLTFSGIETSGTYIKKTINAPEQKGYILELIPSTSEEELNFLGKYEVISYDPLVLSIPMTHGNALYSYVVPEDISQLIDQIQTAAVPYEIEIEPVIDVDCGDGICTELLEDELICPEDCARKLPWLFILSVVIVLVIVIFFIHFFRHRIKALFKREETLFKSESDKENLKNYIKESLKEDIGEEQIKIVLLAKGWTEKQINSIVNEIREESKPKEEFKPEEI